MEPSRKIQCQNKETKKPSKREFFSDGGHTTGFSGTRFSSHNSFQSARGQDYEGIGRSVKENDGKVVEGTDSRPFRRRRPPCFGHTSGFSGERFRSHSPLPNSIRQECESLSRDQALVEVITWPVEQMPQWQGATGNSHFPPKDDGDIFLKLT